MPKIYTEINQQIGFHINLYDTEVARIFFQQHLDIAKQDPTKSKSTIVDICKYTISYFYELVQEAQKRNILAWEKYDIRCGPEHYEENQKHFNDMHKDLEVVAGINKYGDMSVADRRLVDEMHCCLHMIENPDAPLNYDFQGRTWTLFNYYTNIEKNLIPEPIKFSRVIHPGQVCLDYCYVGKEPLVCAIHKDNSMLSQTCKIVDRISLSWKLFSGNFISGHWMANQPDDVDAVLTEWYYENKNDIDAMGYSLQQIIDHTGFCIIGEVDDHSVFEYLNNTPDIEVTDYRLIP